jgi:hypothetical protein
MFFVMTVMLLLEIIILAVVAGRDDCDNDDILNATGTCGVSPGALYVPLTLLMLCSVSSVAY